MVHMAELKSHVGLLLPTQRRTVFVTSVAVVSREDVRTLIKWHTLLDKSALEHYKSLMEGLGTHVPSYECSLMGECH
jgi:hypothetical protein